MENVKAPIEVDYAAGVVQEKIQALLREFEEQNKAVVEYLELKAINIRQIGAHSNNLMRQVQIGWRYHGESVL